MNSCTLFAIFVLIFRAFFQSTRSVITTSSGSSHAFFKFVIKPGIGSPCSLDQVSGVSPIECARRCHGWEECTGVQMANPDTCTLIWCMEPANGLTTDAQTWLKVCTNGLLVDNKCFQTVNNQVMFDGAQSTCENIGMLLAAPSTENQIQSLMEYVTDETPCNHGYYIGLQNPSGRVVNDNRDEELQCEYDRFWAARQPDHDSQVVMAIHADGLYDCDTTHEHCIVCERNV